MTATNITRVQPDHRSRSARHKQAGSTVNEIKRDRIITATVQALEEVGFAQLTISKIIGRAMLSRTTFYEVFADREDCFLGTFEQILAEVLPGVGLAYSSQSDWRDGVRAALVVLLELMDRSPGFARLFVQESLGGGERMLRRRAEVVDEIARVIDGGRSVATAPGPPMLTARVLVGGILEVLHTHLLSNDPESFTALLGPFMYMIVLPYLGAAAATQELGRESAPARAHRRRAGSRPATDSMGGLRMRLTHRTVVVLGVIAALPGASNQEIAQASGIVDPGQISKLLSRLAGLGLLENTGAGQPLGTANCWHLTDLGVQVERATQPR